MAISQEQAVENELNDLCCKISGDPPADPVRTADGYLYDRCNIQEWFDTCAARGRPATSPMTGLKLKTLDLTPAPDARDRLAGLRTPHQQRFAGSKIAKELFDMLGRAIYLLGRFDVEAPCIVVLGNENHGKSTLLERIVGLPFFPRCNPKLSGGTPPCTRMVIRVELRRGGATLATVDVVDRSMTVVSTTDCPVVKLEQAVHDSMDKALKDYGANSSVLNLHELRVRIQHPDFPTLNLVDVPGLVAVAKANMSADTPEVTRALAESVVERFKDSAMFLMVVDSRTRVNSSLAAPIVSRYGLAARTLGVWTKVDVFSDDAGDDLGAVDGMLNDSTLELGFGWCVCCTPSRCAGGSIDDAEAQHLTRRGFCSPADRIGMRPIRSLIEKYFYSFIRRTWLPSVIGKVKDSLADLAAMHAALGTPTGGEPARQHALETLRSESLATCCLARRIAKDLEPVPRDQLAALLRDAVGVAQHYEGDHTALDLGMIAEAQKKLLAEPSPESVTMNDAGARVAQLRGEASDELRAYTLLQCDSVKGPDGRQARMLRALGSHPSKLLGQFPGIKAALVYALDAAVADAVNVIHTEALRLIQDKYNSLARVRIERQQGVAVSVASRTPIVGEVAQEIFDCVVTTLFTKCDWHTLRESIPTDLALWVPDPEGEKEVRSILEKIAEAAQVLSFFLGIASRAAPGDQILPATKADDRDLLLASFQRCRGKPESWVRDRELKDWTGVKVDANGNVITVDLHQTQLAGTPDLAKLPEGLQELRLEQNALCGTLDFTKLPPGLQRLDLSCNQFSFTPDLTKLPPTLLALKLNSNRFCGTPNLTSLPSTLDCLDLSQNAFTGAPDLTRLPPGLRQLFLGRNELRGILDFTKLPPGLARLHLSFNQLSFTPDLTKLPPSLLALKLNSNRFSGTPNLTSLPSKLESLDLSQNAFTGAPDLTRLPPGLRQLFLGRNELCGTLDFTKLPPSLEHLFLTCNQFSSTPDLTNLPPSLLALKLNSNQFCGAPNLTSLPSTLDLLDLSQNAFTGAPDLTRLPATLKKLMLRKNPFSALPPRAQLPAGLEVDF